MHLYSFMFHAFHAFHAFNQREPKTSMCNRIQVGRIQLCQRRALVASGEHGATVGATRDRAHHNKVEVGNISDAASACRKQGREKQRHPDAAHEELAFKESELEEAMLELEVERERFRVELQDLQLDVRLYFILETNLANYSDVFDSDGANGSRISIKLGRGSSFDTHYIRW
jgi:hypothetical protein